MEVSKINSIIAIVKQYVPTELAMHCIESYTHNDPAHDVNHLYYVLREAEYLVSLNDDLTSSQIKCLYTAVLLHDIGCRYDRKTHHTISYGISFDVLRNFGCGCYSKEETMTIAKAVLEHRASGTGEFSSVVSELTALADKGRPDIKKNVTVCVLYRKNVRMPLSIRIDSVIDHLTKKFGDTGYAWDTMPALGKQLYAEDIQKLKDVLKSGQQLRNFVSERIKELS